MPADAAYKTVCDRLKAQPRTWLVTGVAGFIGSNLLEALLKLDQRVIGLDNLSTGHSRNLEEVAALVSPAQWGNFRLITGDIRTLADCARACDGVDYVLHHAALSSVPISLADPARTHAHNVDGFLNMLRAACDAGVKRLVYASSSAVYGDNPGLPATEGAIGHPLSPYALSKQLNERDADTFARTYGLETIGLRYFNIFGPRSDPNGAYAAVIPQWISQMLSGTEVTIHGDGETTRDFCYIADVVQANLLAATTERPDAVNQVYNIGFGEQTSLNALYRAIADTLSLPTSQQPIYGEFRSGDIRHSYADIAKAKTLLGYAPTHSLLDGLAQAIDWYAA